VVDLLYLYFGINLRCFRRNRGFSQSRLGRRTDPPLSQEAISRYERGLQPLERHVQPLADALGVPREALLRRPRIIRDDGLKAVVVQHAQSRSSSRRAPRPSSIEAGDDLTNGLFRSAHNLPGVRRD
jgi:transcriptional regulator with XRE-family HTH domain